MCIIKKISNTLHLVLLLLFASQAGWSQANSDNCPEVTNQDPEWQDVNNGWLYDPARLINGNECQISPEYGPEGYAKSQCTSWARFRSGYKGHGNGGEWDDNFNECETPTGNNTGITCWSRTPSVGSLLIKDPSPGDANGHVAVVECVDPGGSPRWAKVSEYNITPCQFGYREVNILQGGYKFLYPEGRPVSLPTDCNIVPEITSALVTALNSDGSHVSVEVKMRGTTCPGVVHDLLRAVYVNGIAVPSSGATYFNVNVLSALTDDFMGLPSCAEIRYTLLKKEPLSGGGFLITPSAPLVGYNLAAPGNFSVVKTQGNNSGYTFAWDLGCTAIPGTGVLLSCQCGVPGGDVDPVKLPATPPYYRNLVVGAQYNCQLRTYNDGDKSAPVIFTFLTDGNQVPVPAPPTVVDGASCNQKVVQWASVGSGYLYELKIYRNGSDYRTFSNLSGYSQAFTASNDGTYTFTLRAYDRQDASSTSPVSTASTRIINCVLEPPLLTDLSTSGCAGVTLSWGFSEGLTPSPVYKYHIYRKEVGSTVDYQQINYVFGLVNTYVDFYAENGTSYAYKVSAEYYEGGENNQGGESGLSNSRTITAQSPPLAPKAFTTSSDSRNVLIRFTDQSEDETSFIIERSTISNGTYQTIQQLPPLPGVGSVRVTTDLQLPVGTIYYYRVKAVNGACTTNVATAPRSRAIILGPPQNLRVSAQDAGIQLQWTTVRNAGAYEIFRKLPTDSTWPLAPFSVISGTNRFNDNSGTAFQYVVRARADDSGSTHLSAFAGPISLALANSSCQGNPAPAVPVIVSATAVGGTASITWSDQSTDENGFVIEYNPNNLGWRLFQEVVSPDPSSTGTLTRSLNLTDYLGLQVSVNIRAFRRSNEDGSRCYSSYSADQNISLLRAPSAVTVVQYNSTNAFQVRWTYTVTYENWFEVQFRNTPYAPWSGLDLVSSPTKYFNHNSITLNTDYYYRVRAIRIRGGETVSTSEWCTAPSSVRLYRPATPGNFIVSALDPSNPYNGNMKLVWIDLADNEDKHQVLIWKANANTNVFPVPPTRTVNINSDAVTKPLMGSREHDYNGNLSVGNYRFGISARNTLGASDTLYDDYIVYGRPSTPTLTGAAVKCYTTGPSVQLDWTDNSRYAATETEFRIYRREYGESNYTLIHTSPAGSTTYTDDGSSGYPVLERKVYYYYVRAYSAYVNMESNSSTIRNVTTPIMPPVVTGVSASASCAQLTIRWTIADNVDGYRITIRRNGNFYLSFSTQNPNRSSYSSIVTESGNYEAVVQAKSNCYYGEESEQVGSFVYTDVAAPPSGVLAGGGCRTISALWLPVAGATRYRVQAWLDGALRRTVQTTLPLVFMQNLAPGNYTLRIATINTCGASSSEAEKSVSVIGVPPRPVISYINGNCGLIDLEWDNPAYAEYYQVYRRQQGTSVFTLLGKVFCNAIENSVQAGPNTIFYYKVEAGNACGVSSTSSIRSTLLSCANQGPTPEARMLSDDPGAENGITSDALGNLIAYPNPFNKAITFRYRVDTEGIVVLTIYNSIGVPVEEAIKGEYHEKGWHEKTVSLEHLGQGIYIGVLNQPSGIFVVKTEKQ